MSAAPCDLSTRIFSLVAYQKEQENLTALLFLIERTHAHTQAHTYIYVCMAFLKIKAFACVPMGRFGEKGEPK